MADNNDNDFSLGSILKIGGTVGTIGYLSKNSVENRLFNSIPGSGYLNRQLSNSIPQGTTSLLVDRQSIGKSVISKLMALEELSPLHILRTLQLSNLIQPFTEIAHNSDIIHIAADSIRNQSHYYEALIKQADNDNDRKLESRDLRKGLFFKNNTLYGATKEGKINESDIVARNTRLVLGNLTNGEINSPNRVLQKYANVIGSSLSNQSLKQNPLIAVSGGKNNLSFEAKWARSMIRYSAEVGFKTLDNPISGVEELLSGMGANETKLFQSKYWSKLRSISNNVQLGTNGNYSMSLRDSLKVSSKNIAKRGLAVYVGYNALDSLLRTISPSDGLFSHGLASGVGNIFAIGHMNFAKIWSDRFQGYKNQQEQNSPGSTSLIKLMAFPLGGALFGARLAYMGRMKESLFKGMDEAAKKYNVETSSDFLSKFGITREMKPMNKYALIGGLAGAALTLPFLPGALVGQSSQELKDKYSGKTNIAERANRGWFFGGGDIQGGPIKTFSKSSIYRMNAEATTKVRYGDDDTKKRMDPLLHPFAYMRNPYAFEERNQQSMPYPVWGMDVSFGGFFGKAYQATIGSIIKPDVINPNVKEALKQEQYSLRRMQNTPQSSSQIQANSKQYSTVNQQIDAQSPSGMSLTDRLIELLHFKKIGKQVADTTYNDFNPNTNAMTNTKSELGITNKDASLIASGLMKPPPTPQYTPNKEALALAYNSATDFTGLKGWSLSLGVKASGFDPSDGGYQLARSGEATSASRDLLNQNLGDLLGCFIPENRVITENGLIPISEVLVGDKVLSKGNKYRPIKRIIKQPEDMYLVVEITTKSGSCITCTIDHKIPSGSSLSNIVDREAKHITKNDIVVFNDGFCDDYDVVWDVCFTTYYGNVYDLEITSDKQEKNPENVNYYVVENILVHNSGEFQRKILPTSAGSQPDRFNPLQNNAPSWLPSDPNDYFIDFSRGNLYSKVKRGEERLPGEGYAALHPDMKNVKPEDYDLLTRLDILQDVARGSKEQVQTRRQAIQAYKDGLLNKEGKEKLGNILDEEQQLQQKKEFYTKPTQTSINPINNSQSALWEVMRSHSEQPLDMLLPIRPGAKLLHERTAIEDYSSTQLGGSDAAIWTNPYSHFLKPALNKTIRSLPFGGSFIPQETKDQYSVDEFFDKFAYLKARHNGTPTNRTVLGTSMSGLNTKDKLLQFRASLTDEQKDYFNSFSKESSQSNRQKILDMLPEDVARGYEQIWLNNDLAKVAKSRGENVQKALGSNLIQEAKAASKDTGVSLTHQDSVNAKLAVSKNRDNYANQGLSTGERVSYTEAETLLGKVADKEASDYIQKRVGVPDSKFVGWDPRLTADDLKIKTLSIAGQDLKKYGFWKSDEERMKQLEPATEKATQVTNNYESIRRQLQSDRMFKRSLEQSMFSNGLKTTKIDTFGSNYSSFTFNRNGDN